jgi:radical SAM protein with 4Fe4S-binding SPASM domain
MYLLKQILRSGRILHFRPPDHVEQKNGLVLQIWGAEGYWHVVDEEFRELLQALEKPTSLEDILSEHRTWRPHERSIRTQVRRMEKSGLTGRVPKSRFPPLLENVTINLVTACNLDCLTCYVPQELRNGSKLDVDLGLCFLDELRPCFSSHATLSLLGGEPFLHPAGVIRIGQWAKRHKFGCNVSTNGTVLPESLLTGLVEAGLKVQVSLDGAVPETNDAIRGHGTFQKATTTIRRLVEKRVPTTICMVCCRENISEIPEYFRLARKLEVQEVRFIPLKKLGSSVAGSVTPAPQFEIVKAICAELDADPSLKPMCRSDIYSILRSVLRESSRRKTCGTGTQTLLIQADGTIYPCINTTIPKLKLGHITEGKASALTKGISFGQSLSLDSPTHPCNGCHVRRWCLAGCPGETMQQEGALNRPHWNCEDLKRTVTYVMWRLAHEQQTPQEQVARTLI